MVSPGQDPSVLVVPAPLLQSFHLFTVPQEARRSPVMLEASCVITFCDKISHKHSLGVPADYELKQTLPPS